MSSSKAYLYSIALAAVAAACGGEGGNGSTTEEPVTAPTPGASCEQFDSTFAAIQKVIFENHGCTQDVCHGSCALGRARPRADAAYASLVEAASTSSSNLRIQPGEPTESLLFQKLRGRSDASRQRDHCGKPNARADAASFGE